MRKLLAIVLVLAATHAWAYRARPIADLRFDDRSWATQTHVASDGTDFLVLNTVGGHPDERTFTQKVASGRAIGPHRMIAVGDPVSLIWTGTSYLAAWKKERKLWVAPVSREGSLLSTPSEPIAEGAYDLFVAANRNSALAFAYDQKLTVQPLDLEGRQTGRPVIHTPPAEASHFAVAAAADGFAMVVSGSAGTWLMLFRADGTAITSAPVLLDATHVDRLGFFNNAAAIATDGTDTLVVFSTGGYDSAGTLKSARIGANGVLEATHVLHTTPHGGQGGVTSAGLVWDGAQYIAAVNLPGAVYPYAGDASLLRIATDGQRIGDLAPVDRDEERRLNAIDLASNGRELLLPFGNYGVMVDASTLRARRVTLAQTLRGHGAVTLAPGHGGYLVAWTDYAEGSRTVRASRIDAAGHYLDGEGIVLGEHPGGVYSIAIDGSGEQWFVVWSNGTKVFGRFISRGGDAGAPIAIGTGQEVAVGRDGSRYVVLMSDGSLRMNTVSVSGGAGTETTLAELETSVGSDPTITTSYREPKLFRLGGRLLALYANEHETCSLFPPCRVAITATALRLDEPDAAPFVVAEDTSGGLAVAESPTQAIVMWSQYQALRGAFFSADGPGASFQIDGTGTRSSVAFDGTDFVAAWWLYGAQDASFATARIAANGAVSGKTIMRLDDAEYASDPVVAASAGLRPLVGFLQKHPTYDNISRGGLLFTNEIETTDIAPPHEPPKILCATRNADDTITVRWERTSSHVLGVSIELQLSDGTFREIGVAPSFATLARVSPAGLEGSRVRVRSFNTGGFSPPSGLATMIPPPQANLRWSTTACAGVPTTIEITLNGTPPFAVRWEDGLVQSNLTTSTATRVVTLTHDTTFTIVSVSDASCATNELPESVRIAVNPQPAIADQTHQVRISRGETATLAVTANEGARFAWFEGARGDTSHPVGTGAHSFTTPPLTASTRYWVRVSNRCGSVDSQTIRVAVSGRRRSARP